MKIIDLLVKIANGEEMPKRIIYNNITLEYDEENEDYFDYYDDGLFEYQFTNRLNFLNDEVEIIIEEPTIEKLEDRIERAVEFLETQYNTYPNGEMRRDALKNILQGKIVDDVYEPFIEDDKKLEKIDFMTLNTQKAKNRAMRDAINKIIDEINSTKGR